VRHTMSIAVPPALLPSLIPRRLEESLNVLWQREREDATAQTREVTCGPAMSNGPCSAKQFAGRRS
jgi:hypothetical protein